MSRSGPAGLRDCLVFDDLDADHEAAAANVADDGMLGDPGAEALEHLFADGGGVLHAFAFEDVHGGEGGGDADGVAAEGAGVGAGDPVHDFGAGHADAERHAGGDAFGDADDVGLDAGVLDGPPLARCVPAPDWTSSAMSRMPWRSQMRADLLEEVVGGDDVAAFALDGLDDDGGDFFGREDGLEELVFDVARAAEGEGFLLLRAAGACRDRRRDSGCG